MQKGEIKRNLLGALEVALLMPNIEKRFRSDYNEALRSFFVPLILFPFALIGIYMFQPPSTAGLTDDTISRLYSLRYAFALGMFFGLVYVIANKLDRGEHFVQFVTATNWAAVPSTIALIPVLLMVSGGAYSADEMMPFLMCVIFYSYALTAFIAMRVFRMPWEMGMFVAFVALAVNQGSFRIVDWVAQLI